MNSQIKELAFELYNKPYNKRMGVEFEQLPAYEQALWEQSAKQVLKARQIFPEIEGVSNGKITNTKMSKM